MRLKISNKLRTISLSSKFICSCIKKKVLENNHHSTNTKQHIASSLKTHIRTFYGVFITLAGKAEIEIFVLVSASFSQRSGCMIWVQPAPWSPEVESSRTFFASRTHFEVLGLGLKASKPQILENGPVLGSRTALFFKLLKVCGAPKNFFGKRYSLKIARKKILKTFFLESTCACVLGPWPRAFLSLALEGLSSVGLLLALASDFFVFLALASSLVSSTPPLLVTLFRHEIGR